MTLIQQKAFEYLEPISNPLELFLSDFVNAYGKFWPIDEVICNQEEIDEAIEIFAKPFNLLYTNGFYVKTLIVQHWWNPEKDMISTVRQLYLESNKNKFDYDFPDSNWWKEFEILMEQIDQDWHQGPGLSIHLNPTWMLTITVGHD